jgi:polar amino acid transport system substrate-binding protein
VPRGSKISDIAQVDRAGVRLAVVERGSPDAFLTRTLESATLVRATALPGALELLVAGKADALGGLKPNMYAASTTLSGSRVLEGRPGAEGAALAVPKDRHPAALGYARRFIEDAKRSGLVQQAIDRAGLRGAVVRLSPRTEPRVRPHSPPAANSLTTPSKPLTTRARLS